jgi:hypothetical protein
MIPAEDLFVGFVALGLVALITVRIVKGLRSGRLPVYRSYLNRDESRAKFNALVLLHSLTLIAAAVIAADLLLGLDLLGRRS